MTTAAQEVVKAHVLLFVCTADCSHLKVFQALLTIMDVSVGETQVKQAQSWHLKSWHLN